MKYKALAFDLDGTLLVGEDLPDRNRVAVRAAYDAGYRVVIATARWRQMAQRIEAQIGISGPAITCSGAQVYCPDVGGDVFDERLPADFTADLYALCDEDRCIATVTVGDRVLLKLDGEPDPSQTPEEMHWVRQLTGADDSLPRVAAIQGSKVNQRIRDELQPKYRDSVHFFDSIGPTGKVILTLTASTASKGDALRAACAHMNINAAEVVAFGDSENDIEMFRAAGASVAMGQADEKTRAAATTVTAPHDEAGVAHAVEHLLATGDIV
ncbi:MAG: Cof-type HAD-IIB family hydrolase [Gammaproteobacteria bacterium]|nr:Cof-type HAD-IIB family hydrolase [Gammaproteobacteria bacterium]